MTYTIALDAGHGWDSPKGVPSMKEFDFNRCVVKYAKELAEYNGFNVILTQPIEAHSLSTSLSSRTQLAINNKVDLLVSIHADANNDHSIRGYWNFYWLTNKESKRLANLWIQYASDLLPTNNRGSIPGYYEHWANFHMIRIPSINTKHQFPSILCECGFMTNREDLNLLLSDDYRKKCAEITIRAICTYFNVEFKLKEGGNVDTPQWKLDIINKAIDEGLIIEHHNPNDIADKWFVLQTQLNLLDKIKKMTLS